MDNIDTKRSDEKEYSIGYKIGYESGQESCKQNIHNKIKQSCDSILIVGITSILVVWAYKQIKSMLKE